MGIETRNSISHEIRCQGQREASDPGSLNQGGPLFQHDNFMFMHVSHNV